MAGTGAVLGAGLSTGLVAVAGFAFRAANVAVPGGSLVATAGIGAALGAVLTPMTALSLLRRVALGKALLFTMLGMAAGVSAAELATGRWMLSAASGFGGFLIVALLLRLRSGSRRTTPTKRSPGE